MVQGLLFKLGVHAEVHNRVAINIDDVNNVVLDKDNWREGERKKNLLLFSVTAVATLNIT